MFDEKDIDELLCQYPDVEVAFAYGSGVLRQSGYDYKEDSSKLPMIDLVFAVKNAEKWHEENLKMNPTHYTFDIPLSTKKITFVQEKIGAGMWYNTYLPINISKFPDRMIKYGIISFDMLLNDLNEWSHGLYIAGRLHKPVLFLKGADNVEFQQALYRNFEHAVNISLLMLPNKFNDFELYRQIAGLSYLGDIRMHVAENPNKINNLVSPQMKEYRRLYKSTLQHYLNKELNGRIPYVSRGSPDAGESIMNASEITNIQVESTMFNYALQSLDASRVKLIGETMNRLKILNSIEKEHADNTDESFINYSQLNGSELSKDMTLDNAICIRYNMLCNLPLAIRKQIYAKPPHLPMELKWDHPGERKLMSVRILGNPNKKLLQSAVAKTVSSKSKGGLFGSKEKNRSSDDGDYAMKNMEKRRHKTSTIADEETVMESTTGEEIVWPEDNEVNWDVILVFENPDYAENLNKEKPEGFMTMKEIMFEIQSKTGLLTYMFYSVNKKLIFCKVGATIDRIKKAADELDYNMLLDEHYLATEVDNGEFPVQDEPDISLMKPYECIYGPYERENEYHDLYHCPPDSLHPFRSVDRIKLVLEVLQSDEDWGAGLELFALKQNGSLLNYYPLREAKFVQALEKDWMPWHIYPWEQPIDDIRDYFGEKIGLYFEFLGHYTSWLLPLSIVGTITGIGVFIESLIYKDLSEALGTSFLVPGCCVFVAFWAQFMLEFWKRKESTKSMEWGMSSFEDEETDRAEYYGDKIFSFINGQPIKYFPPSQRAEISRTSNALIMAMILLVIACVAVIFYGKYYVNNDVDDDSAAASGSQGLAIVNALQIQVLNYLYQELAIWLTNRENHRTDTEHEDSLIAKLFLFQFVNSYASFFYIAYIKQNVGDECVGSCMEELSIALATIFLTRLIVGNATKFLTFYGAKVLRERTEKQEAEAARLEGNTDYLKEKSRAEKDYHLDDWDPMLGTLENYSQISVEFGFVTLFVAAFPLAPLFAYVSNVVEIRSDGYTLLHHTKRPIPSGAQDIGTWMDIFQMTALASVITNAGIICFTMELIQASPQGIVWAFICLQYSIIGLMALFAYIVPDVPEEVTIQLQRMQHLTDMAYGRLEIEDNEFEVEAQEYCIFDIDNED